MWAPSLSQEDPLEEKMATHSNIFAWRIPWTEEPGELQFMGLQRIRHNWATAHTWNVDTCLAFLPEFLVTDNSVQTTQMSFRQSLPSPVDMQTQEGKPAQSDQQSRNNWGHWVSESASLWLPVMFPPCLLFCKLQSLSFKNLKALVLLLTTIIRNESSPEDTSSWSLAYFLMVLATE